MLIIQSILFFILGAASACFFMLLLVPIIWRRALALATRAVRMEIPLSLNEVEAEHDFARAIHAIEICRMEEKIAHAKKQAMTARLALDMANAKICYLAPFEEESDKLQQKISQMRAEETRLMQENAAQSRQLEKMLMLQHKKHEDQVKIKAQKSTIKRLKQQISALRRDMSQLDKQKNRLEHKELLRRKNEQMESEELIALRQEIKQVAAHITADIAHAQGKDSAIPAMIGENSYPQDLAGFMHQAILAKQPSLPEEEAKIGHEPKI